jgi:hypothetical protein
MMIESNLPLAGAFHKPQQPQQGAFTTSIGAGQSDNRIEGYLQLVDSENRTVVVSMLNMMELIEAHDSPSAGAHPEMANRPDIGVARKI